ncbi:MAG: hypothetical protein E6Q97_27860 [Desulfurellales bacterium]|nr:MAG: hypothetical protein E6Q97_27860 [Desulfurellales bacterium]
MFSVRWEPSPSSRSNAGHIMYQAEQYTVSHQEDGHGIRLTLQSTLDGAVIHTVVHLADHDVAYVMNDHGVTVDVLRTRASKKEKKS